MSFAMKTERTQIRPAGWESPAFTQRSAIAFETLVRRLSPTLKAIAHRLDGRLSFADDQDLFQEGLLHLWTQFTAGNLSDKTDSYVLQGCYYHMRNYVRKTRDKAILMSMSGTPEGEDFTLEESLAGQDLSTQNDVDETLHIEAIVESGMSRRERDVLLLSLEGMTTREIGSRLGVSHVSVVKTRNRIKKHYIKLNGPRLTSVSSSVGHGRF